MSLQLKLRPFITFFTLLKNQILLNKSSSVKKNQGICHEKNSKKPVISFYNCLNYNFT